MVRILYTTLYAFPYPTLYTALEHALHTKSIALTGAADTKMAMLASVSTAVSPHISPAIVAISTTAGGHHMDKVNEETPDERGMIIKGVWRSIGILSIFAITHIASSLWEHPRG
ncbi:hypothetical protein Y032_0036g3236 [Ancylostoma ceylanicum]|uniref:Uncharacterized protein n=1 Tax=Ancylostoma ceylanicum TaxID=53326 RepID=A0A016UL93_9BILA|nr:hypothetical protein Y032_0036g3236 [Ancylostoma ceylanicum]